MSSSRPISLIAILILLLVACTPGGEEPAASEVTGASTPESGLATVPPTEDGKRIEGDGATKEQATMSTGEKDPSSDASSSKDVITPVEVDPSKMTPEAPAESSKSSEVDPSKMTPAGSGEAVEMPEPGRPKPQTAMVNQAAQDLAKRLDIAVNDVQVVEVEDMQWSDSSLGCPSSDGYYRQVITPGFRITLRAEGATYDYHTDTSRTVILCGPDGQPVP